MYNPDTKYLGQLIPRPRSNVNAYTHLQKLTYGNSGLEPNVLVNEFLVPIPEDQYIKQQRAPFYMSNTSLLFKNISVLALSFLILYSNILCITLDYGNIRNNMHFSVIDFTASQFKSALPI